MNQRSISLVLKAIKKMKPLAQRKDAETSLEEFSSSNAHFNFESPQNY